MTGWWDIMFAAHRQVLEAQKASLAAAAEAVKAQEQGRRLIEANQRAVGQWARLWGVK
ncbi:MAG: hypothetical protein JO290_03845 [Sphingomonadaceae bacterium]|nr:hypothetical protein [Sphingomonadaceae bacterium]